MEHADTLAPYLDARECRHRAGGALGVAGTEQDTGSRTAVANVLLAAAVEDDEA